MMNQIIEFMKKMKRKMQRRGFVMIHSLCKSKQQSRRQASPVEIIGQASADSASVAMIYRSELDYISLEGTKRSVYLRESPKMMEEPRIEIVR